jgi:hypothetical protein
LVERASLNGPVLALSAGHVERDSPSSIRDRAVAREGDLTHC